MASASSAGFYRFLFPCVAGRSVICPLARGSAQVRVSALITDHHLLKILSDFIRGASASSFGTMWEVWADHVEASLYRLFSWRCVPDLRWYTFRLRLPQHTCHLPRGRYTHPASLILHSLHIRRPWRLLTVSAFVSFYR